MSVRSQVRTPSEWQLARERHQELMQPFASERVTRMSVSTKHPVRDFLFDYYSQRPAKLMRWSPGADVVLLGATPRDLEWQQFHETTVDGIPAMVLRATDFPPHRVEYLRWAEDYLRRTGTRLPLTSCFGLHEWAMLYRDPEVRHPYVPLRLSLAEIAEVVDAELLQCTHYDAFRFFTNSAAPKNLHQLERRRTNEFDQPACIHVNMDLYRFAYKISPWIDSTLVGEAFRHAWRCREIDMRASPYDLSSYGYEPIPIETPPGKAQYVQLQRELMNAGQPLRQKILAEYEYLLSRTANATS
ncbi:MAG: 3-methyladenine DNA glycosylase [Zavarzinella sp.]